MPYRAEIQQIDSNLSNLYIYCYKDLFDLKRFERFLAAGDSKRDSLNSYIPRIKAKLMVVGRQIRVIRVIRGEIH